MNRDSVLDARRVDRDSVLDARRAERHINGRAEDAIGFAPGPKRGGNDVRRPIPTQLAHSGRRRRGGAHGTRSNEICDSVFYDVATLLVARASLSLILISSLVIAASIAAILSSRLEPAGRSSRILGYETTGAATGGAARGRTMTPYSTSPPWGDILPI